MKTKVLWDGGNTQIELIPENEGEKQILALLEDKKDATIEVVWDSPNKQYRKLLKAVVIV